MERSQPLIVSRKTLTHRMASAGYRPSDVWFAIDNYADALGIAPRDTQVYSMDPVEIAAFTLYLDRQLVAVSPEEQECRIEALQFTTQALMASWGDTPEAVTRKLALDTSHGATYADILDTVELYVSGAINVTAVTAGRYSIMVDGVDVDYPNATHHALLVALQFAASRASVEPF